MFFNYKKKYSDVEFDLTTDIRNFLSKMNIFDMYVGSKKDAMYYDKIATVLYGLSLNNDWVHLSENLENSKEEPKKSKKYVCEPKKKPTIKDDPDD